MLSIEKVDSFPEITRSGRVSEELQMIVEYLELSAKNGERFAISGVEEGNSYNSMQQRIRTQAKKRNLKVIIRYDKNEKKLYFKASPMANEKVPTATNSDHSNKDGVKASSVKGVRSAKKDVEELAV